MRGDSQRRCVHASVSWWCGVAQRGADSSPSVLGQLVRLSPHDPGSESRCRRCLDRRVGSIPVDSKIGGSRIISKGACWSSGVRAGFVEGIGSMGKATIP